MSKEQKYLDSVALNDLLIPLISIFQDTGQGAEKIFVMLKEITDQEIHKFSSQTGKCGATKDDMRQEAYIKLIETLQNYREHKSPVFISFWRRALRNHLLSNFKKPRAELHSQPEDFLEHRRFNHNAKLVISEIRDVMFKLFSSWKNSKHKALAADIIDNRILCQEEDKLLHSEIAQRNGISAGFVSKWEDWLRNLILQTFQ